jgi:hypothetical protein
MLLHLRRLPVHPHDVLLSRIAEAELRDETVQKVSSAWQKPLRSERDRAHFALELCAY